MNITEYNKIKKYTYLEYCDYLQNKYGVGKYDYMTKNFKKSNRASRTSEGLIAHHKMESVGIMLSNPTFARLYPYSWQLKENLVYFDYLEHLLLHILICELPKDIDNSFDVGIGDAINFIIPELNDYYSGWVPKQNWKINCLKLVENQKEVFLILVDRFIKCVLLPRKIPISSLNTSFNEEFGLWNKENNKMIFKEYELLYNRAFFPPPLDNSDTPVFDKLKEHWINILTIDKAVIDKSMLIAFFDYKNTPQFGFNHFFADYYSYEYNLSSPKIIKKVYSHIPNFLLADDEIFDEILCLINDDVIYFYPYALLDKNKIKKIYDCRGFLGIFSLILKQDSLSSNVVALDSIKKILVKNYRKTFDVWAELPEYIKDKNFCQNLRKKLKQNHRPKYCPKEVWKAK